MLKVHNREKEAQYLLSKNMCYFGEFTLPVCGSKRLGNSPTLCCGIPKLCRKSKSLQRSLQNEQLDYVFKESYLFA